MKRRLFCLLMAVSMLGSSIVVNASELPKEDVLVNETVQEEAEAETDEAVQEETVEETDETPEEAVIPEETPAAEVEQPTEAPDEEPAATEEPEEEMIPEEEPQTDEQASDEETQADDELLGAAIDIEGADLQENAVPFELNQEYASKKKDCWYKFTTKSEPAYYRFWIRNAGTNVGGYNISLWDGHKQILRRVAWSQGENSEILGDLEPNTTYYIYAEKNTQDFYYLFSITSYDDPEGNSAEEAYPLSLGETYQGTLAVGQDEDYFRIQTEKEGHYLITATNASVSSSLYFELQDRYGSILARKNWIDRGKSNDIPRTLEGNTTYYIRVDSGGSGNYSIKAEYLTDNEGDTRETAYNLKEDVKYSTDLCARDDVDFYKLTPKLTAKYIVSISNHSSSGYRNYKLTTEREEPLKNGSASSERTVEFELELTEGSAYYLEISGDGGKYTVSYRLKFPFTDVPLISNNWKYVAVNYVNEKGVMTGVSDTLFSPDTALTRAQFASILYRMAGEPYVSHKNVFYDVPSGKWYSKAVIWAYNQKIVAGYSNGYFGINDPITREQVARMLYLYSEWKGKDVSARANLGSFPDGGQVSGWAKTQVEWAVGMNMISGKTVNGRLQLVPKGQATRAECASMISRYLQANE